MRNQLLKQMFAHSDHGTRVMLGLLEAIAGDAKTQKVLDDLFPSSPVNSMLFEGRRLDEYAGLSRAQLKNAFGFSDEQVDALYKQLNVVDNSADVDGAGDEANDETAGEGSTGGADSTAK